MHQDTSKKQSVLLRRASEADSDAVAAIWLEGWRAGHLGGVPEALVAARTPASFRVRAAARVSDTTLAVVDGAIAGFIMVVADEVEQVYVAAAYRGRGVAQVLLDAAEQHVLANGYSRAWLAVVAKNSRARAFYEKSGWTDLGPFDYEASTETGTIIVPAHRYVKRLSP